MNRQKDIQPILKALLVFETAAREGNFTKAAHHLGMPQPSVSRYIANLEAFIETPLFHRRHNRIELTDTGDILFKATELGLAHIRTVINNLTQDPVSEHLTIACTHGFAHMWVLPRIERLRSLLPNQDIRLSTSEHPPEIGSDDADIVIRFGKDNWPNMRSIRLFGERVFPVCTAAFLKSRGLEPENIQPAELVNLPLIAQDFGDFGWMNWPEFFNHFGVASPKNPDKHPVPSYHFVLQAAAEGKGIALAWSHLIEPYLSNGWLIELPNIHLQTDKGYFATYADDHIHAEAISTWLKEVETLDEK